MQRPRGKHIGPVWSADGRPGAGGGAHGEAAAARCFSKPAVTLQATKPPLALRQGGCHVVVFENRLTRPSRPSGLLAAVQCVARHWPCLDSKEAMTHAEMINL